LANTFFPRHSRSPAFRSLQLLKISAFQHFLIMALKIRLQRHGASHRPFYRMVVTEALARRDGRFVEVLGTYEPQAKRAEDELSVKLDRVDYWKSVGAKPTDTAASLIRKARREAPAEASAEA
jgi:small subunit ribosomal protein S16